MDMPPARVWIALPTYNERDNLEPMVRRLLEVMPGAGVLVVDDSSPDGTGEVADALAMLDRRVRVLHRSEKDGLGAAYRAAFSELLELGADMVVQIDCDFSHDPGDVPRLLAALSSDADLAIGSRYVPGGATPGWSWFRRGMSRGGSIFARTVLGLPVRDLTGGFKAWRADLLRGLDLAAVETKGYGFQIETTWRAARLGARIIELPIVFAERRAGKSKMTRRIVLEALGMVLRLRLRQERRARRSARLAVGDALRLGHVNRTGGVAVEDLAPVDLALAHGPAAGAGTAHRAREPEPRIPLGATTSELGRQTSKQTVHRPIVSHVAGRGSSGRER